MVNRSGWYQTDDGEQFHAYGRRGELSPQALQQAAQVIAIFQRAEREGLSQQEMDDLLSELQTGMESGTAE